MHRVRDNADKVEAAQGSDNYPNLTFDSLSCRHPFQVEHVKASAHLASFLGGVVQTILLRAAETPPHAKYWALSACIYSAFFSVSRVRSIRSRIMATAGQLRSLEAGSPLPGINMHRLMFRGVLHRRMFIQCFLTDYHGDITMFAHAATLSLMLILT